MLDAYEGRNRQKNEQRDEVDLPETLGEDRLTLGISINSNHPEIRQAAVSEILNNKKIALTEV